MTLSTVSHSEIEKLASPCKTSICFYWWPKLPIISGWHQDKEQSFSNTINAQAPEGFTFSNAETVIYAKAIYKPREPELTSLEELINRDIKDFKNQDTTINVSNAAEINTKGNIPLKSFNFFPKQDGNWEQVTYGEEGDFYLIFTISSRSKQGYEKSINDYIKFINEYAINP